MIVSDFQREIVAVAKKESGGLGDLGPVAQILSIAIFIGSALYTFDWFGNLWYHVFGFVVALGSVAVVRLGVEPGIVSCSLDRRFSEYGLGSSFQYESVFLRRGVGGWGWALIVRAVAKILFSLVLPPYGFSILVMVPFEYLDTRKVIAIMKKSYIVGDEVGTLIKAGRTEDEVSGLLSKKILANRRERGSLPRLKSLVRE